MGEDVGGEGQGQRGNHKEEREKTAGRKLRGLGEDGWSGAG